jgi:hypothetical protein
MPTPLSIVKGHKQEFVSLEASSQASPSSHRPQGRNVVPRGVVGPPSYGRGLLRARGKGQDVSLGDYIERLSDVDRAYAERNAVVIAFAHMAEQEGWRVGLLEDPTEPEWPVIVIETPRGQVSWHIPADELPVDRFDARRVEWDGHSTREKYNRLERLFMSPERTAINE